MYILVQFLLRAFPYVVKSLIVARFKHFKAAESDSKTSKNVILTGDNGLRNTTKAMAGVAHLVRASP